MPWCPKCKNEYREGIKICADCGCELVESEQLTNMTPLIFGEEEEMLSLKKFLEYNKLKQVVLRFDEKESVYEILVSEEDIKKANAMAKVFLEQEAERKEVQKQGKVQNQPEMEQGKEARKQKGMQQGEEVENQQEKQQGIAAQKQKEMREVQEETEEKTQGGKQGAMQEQEIMEAALYKNSSERAEDNRSSAWILLGVGTVGIVVMVLGILGIVPLRIGNPYMFYGVMSAVFFLFIVMGAISMKNARIFAKKAESENSLQDTLISWCRGNLDAAGIDAEIGIAEGDAEELLYFKRYEKIKEKLNHQFMNLDQAFLDHFIDEIVYDMIFE